MSDQLISLGHRLKIIAKCISPSIKTDDNKSGYELENALNNLEEIAKVEGYDDNSYVMEAIKAIHIEIKNNDLTRALKKINKTINDVMPFDYEEFFQLFEATQTTAERLKDRICWVLLGPTGSGKSTSIHFLCGSKFKIGNAGSVIVDTIGKSLKNKEIKIGEKVTESKTRYIEAVELDLKQYSKKNDFKFECNHPKKIIWVDSPGFEDTAGPEVNMANGIGTIRALRKAKKVKIIITFKEAHLDYRFHIIRNIANNMGKAINNLENELEKPKDKSGIAGFLTKSHHGIKSAQKTFNKARDEQEEKDENSDENALFKALIYKLGEKGPLYEIHIDVENNNNNQEERKKIIKSLVEDTGYIDAPNEIFNEFISELVLNKLKAQIDKNYETIQNILENDKYFENPKYIKYIINILNNLATLKQIIKNAGGNYVESKLIECMNILQMKWNYKIAKANKILADINIKECRIISLQNKLKEFNAIKYIMKQNMKVIKSCKYYKSLKEINCLNEGLHKCFDQIYEIISNYLKDIRGGFAVDDSDVDSDFHDTDYSKTEQEDTKSSLENELIDDDNYNNYNNYIYNEINNDKIILKGIEKCFFLYKKCKNDKYIRRKFRTFQNLVDEVIDSLKMKSYNFMDSKQSQNITGISKLMFILSAFSKLHNILRIIHEKHRKKLTLTQSISHLTDREISDNCEQDLDDDINANKSTKVIQIERELSKQLKLNTAKSIKSICKSYTLNVMNVIKKEEKESNNYNYTYVDVNTLLNSKVIKTDDEISKRENKLISFCSFINTLNESLGDVHLSDIFTELQNWLNDVENKCIKWLCGACLIELKTCNNLLNKDGAQTWNNVEKLLHECESLRKVSNVEKDTSQEYFKTLSEFDFRKTALAKEAATLIEDFNNLTDDTNINYDKIIKIANKLYNAGCNIESNEMKQIYNKLKQHVRELQTKTEVMSLSIEMTDDLSIIQNTMQQLDTLQTFAIFMPNIKQDASECYKILNDQVLDVLNEIKSKYDLSKYSTENSRKLKDKLKIYLTIKNNIDENILKNVIMQCELKTLTELINLNKNKIKKLQNKNKFIDQKMKEKSVTVSTEIIKYEKLIKQCKHMLLNLEQNEFAEWIKPTGFKSLKEIRNKLNTLQEQSDKICIKEKEAQNENKNKINELNKINNEAEKLVEIENILIELQPDNVIEYRTRNNFVQNSIDRLDKLLEKNQNYIFPQKLSLYDAYGSLNFINKCKVIKWNLISKTEDEYKKETNVLSNKYVNQINSNIKGYLKAYGDILESHLNDLMDTLAIKDVAKCDLNDTDYMDHTQNAIAKLNECLSEFREIANFDHQIKMQMEDTININKQEKQLKLVSRLFTNHDIQLNVVNYITNIISMHKQDLVIIFNQYKVQQPDKLPVLRYICLSMSSLDRFVSVKKDEHDTYYRIASQIDNELTKFGNSNTKQILPLFRNGSWEQLKQILNALKKTADADKIGVGQKHYRDAVLQLFSALHKLMNETKTKLLIDINKDTDINDEKILSLKKGLENVKNLVEIIYPHLYDKIERDKIKKEEKALGSLLSDRLKQLMKASLQSAQKREFKQCEKRLDNISRLMDYNTQFYINDMDDDKNDDDMDNKIVKEYKKIKEEIDNELNKVLIQVKEANKKLKDPKTFNPYNRLRLTSLYAQLSKSQNEQFRGLWFAIYDEIINTIQNILLEIKERNDKIQMQSEYDMAPMEQKMETKKKRMTYSEQETYLRKIDIALSKFPNEMKEGIRSMLRDTKDCAKGNIKFIDDGFKQFLNTNAWNEVARNLNEFEQNDPKFFQTSRKLAITKIKHIHKTFDINMKNGIKGFINNIDLLDSYKSIAISFTTFKYYNTNCTPNSNPYVINHVQITLDQMYRQIENKFTNQCKDIKSSLNGHKPYKYLKDGFYVIIKVLENKDKLPENFAQNIMNEANQLNKPIKKLINTLKTKKYKGLDKDINDIDPLIVALNELKELNEVQFHLNIRKFINIICDSDEKENKEFEKNIDKIEYDISVVETQDLITEFKESISKEGLNKNIIQRNQAKRLNYLRELSKKCKALIQTSNICSKHLDMEKDEFNKKFIKPCTKRMRRDILSMQKETVEAFSGKLLNTKSLQRANANLEAFYAIKNVFEKELNDDQFCKEMKIDDAIQICQEAANKKVIKLTKEIRKKQLNADDVNEEYLETTAENLMNLEYLNQHMNFKTSINENVHVINHDQEANELHQNVQHAIKKSMNFLTDNKETKAKINVLYNHLIETDANYGAVFIQKQPVFEASLLEIMNQKFRELNITSIVENLKQTENDFKHKKMHPDMVDIDYDKITNIFNQISNKYDELLVTNLRNAKSFEQLIQENLPHIISDAKSIANKAVSSKTYLLNKFLDSGVSLVRNSFSWFTDQSKSKNNKNNARGCYWTPEMRNAIPKLIPYILAVWTLSSASCYYENTNSLKKARNAQIVSICCVLCLDVTLVAKKLINNLVEIGTGEGKSLIMAITSIVLALLDFDVYCACYSELLSKRDQNEFNDLFIKFGVQTNIKYQTFNNILEQMINDGGDVREMAKNIVLNYEKKTNNDDKKMNNNDDYLLKRQKILFIDEVDKFFSTDFFGKQYTPSCIIPSDEMKQLILFVWKQYLNNNCQCNNISISKIEESNEYYNLLKVFKEEWHDLLRESMKDIIDGIRTFKEDHYTIENGRDICYKFSDTYSSKVFYGYRTLFTYLYELNRGNITDESYVYSKLTWFLKCGSFSYSEIPNTFYAILGVTGTLKSLSQKEHQVMQKSYGVKKYVCMPSLFDKTGKLEYAQNRDIFIIQPEYFFNQLHATMQLRMEQSDNNNNKIERPIIVFFRDETILNYFCNLDICKTWRINDRIQLLTPDLSEIEKKNGILNATKSNCITFATEEYGRGIDFKVFDKKLEMVGMHVELTYWPNTLAEEIQIKGRTARQGQKGSFHIILNEAEITDQCNVSSRDIEMHRKNGDLYEWLNTIRNKVFEKQYDEASKYVEELKPVHKNSQQLAMSLRIKNIRVAKQQLLLFNKGANIQSAAKLSILIDATGSMGSCLNQCKTVIQKTIPQLVKFLKNNNINSNSFEIQIIAYRNYDTNAENILEFCPFTSDENELTKFIHSVRAKNGWGREEAVEIGFAQLNRQEKKPNIILLMADAPAHTKNDMIRKRQNRYGEEYWKTARNGIFANILDWNEELNKFMTENNNDASVFCFYLLNYAKSNFKKIAKIGNGRSMYLDVNNEIQSISLLQSALSETILLKINNGNMQYVEQFRKENKNMPTFL